MTACAHCPELRRLRKQVHDAKLALHWISLTAKRGEKACRTAQTARSVRRTTTETLADERAANPAVGADAPGAAQGGQA